MSSVISKYLRYKIKAVSKHKIHSPFVFDFINEVLENNASYYAFPAIELVKKQLLSNKQVIHVEDLGAGSRKNQSNQRSISEIAKVSVVDEKFGELLFKIVNYYQPETIIELGTSLGISAAYMAKARKTSKVFSIDGSKEISRIARRTLDTLKIENVHLITGSFDESLPLLIERLDRVDLVYFDGNHRKDPTVHYFKKCIGKADEKSIFIFDDIHWSDEMEETWEIIKKDERVTITIDLFRMGIVFFGKQMPKQDFILKF